VTTVVPRRLRKTCPGCDESLLLTAFNRNRSTKDGLQTYCRACSADPSRRNRKRVARGNRSGEGLMVCTDCQQTKPAGEFGWRSDGSKRRKSHCRDCWNDWRAENRRDNPQRTRKENREYNVRRYRGMTEALFNKMFIEQQGRCGVCNEPMLPTGRGLESAHIDHDHATGKIRELLHGRCNTGIGLLREDVDTLFGATAYLLKHSTDTLTEPLNAAGISQRN